MSIWTSYSCRHINSNKVSWPYYNTKNWDSHHKQLIEREYLNKDWNYVLFKIMKRVFLLNFYILFPEFCEILQNFLVRTRNVVEGPLMIQKNLNGLTLQLYIYMWWFSMNCNLSWTCELETDVLWTLNQKLDTDTIRNLKYLYNN